MSSKPGTDQPVSASAAWSLAARLTAWYAGSSFVLILAAVGSLYLGLSRSLDREDDDQLADQVRVLRDTLAARPGDLEAVRREAGEEFQSRQRTRVYVRLLDADGRVLVETPGYGGLLPPADCPTPADAPDRGTAGRFTDGRPVRLMAVRVVVGPTGYVVQTAIDRTPEAELLAEYRRNLWAVLGAALVCCGGVGYQIARRGLRPVRRVTDTARRIDPAHLGERIDPAGLPAELLALADTVNAMLDRLEASFTRLARFSADIAHELRTPVNNLRGGVEVALGQPRTPGEYREVLGSALEECGRLARLIDSLLFLARAENPRAEVARERVDVGTELHTVREFYEPAAADRGIRLEVVADCRVEAVLNRPLFQRAVGNLIENALAHTPAGGRVALSVTPAGGWVEVVVTDTGRGIPPDHLPHVFDRFYRADPARTSTGGNLGLGLAIVRGVAEIHGGTAVAESDDGRGMRLRMRFPAPDPAGPA